VVRPRDGVAQDPTARGDGGDEGYVGQVGAARVGVVYGEDVAGLGVAAHDRSDRLGHRSEVHRDVLGLGDHLSFDVEEGGRAVAPLFYVR
jgi:hypothetical protein